MYRQQIINLLVVLQDAVMLMLLIDAIALDDYKIILVFIHEDGENGLGA